VLCLIVAPLPPDKNPFAVKINNNNKKIIKESIAIKTTVHQSGAQPNSKTSHTHISNTPEIMDK
jgi:hypothetical protein